MVGPLCAEFLEYWAEARKEGNTPHYRRRWWWWISLSSFCKAGTAASKAKQEALGNATESHSERFLQNNHEKQSQLSKTNRLECGKSVESGATVVLLDCV